MRLAKLLYYSVLDSGKFFNVGNILFEMDGVYQNLENIPDSYLKQKYGYTKEELMEMISNEIEWDIDE